MNSSNLHHIRLLAGFEVQPNPACQRLLDRGDCEKLANALAADLARVVPAAGQAMLAVAGCLFEPNELLRPGFEPWNGLDQLARPVVRDHGASGQILAIGAHAGRLPDARLMPGEGPPAGQFLALPMLLIMGEDTSVDLHAQLERDLFESGGIHPPARAILAETCAIDSVHGQLLTLADLMALQHVQMDSAGLGAFWPVIEHALIDAASQRSFELPAGLSARWQTDQVGIDFQSFDQYGQAPDDYALWVRAFRSLCALLDSHGVAWKAVSELTHDDQRDCLVETAGINDQPNSLTRQIHSDCGLVAWTLVEDGHQINLYPLSSRAFGILQDDLRARALPLRNDAAGICYDAVTFTLRPASTA